MSYELSATRVRVTTRHGHGGQMVWRLLAEAAGVRGRMRQLARAEGPAQQTVGLTRCDRTVAVGEAGPSPETAA